MTESQAVHLIEQFATQCPFAIWILDSRGVAVFANGKLHELLGTLKNPPTALGINLFTDPVIEELNLRKHFDRLRAGETVNATVDARNPNTESAGSRSANPKNLDLRLIAYPLFSSAQKIEHFVVFIEDITQTYAQRDELRDETEDIKLFLKSKESRMETLETLKKEAEELEEEIRELGGEADAESP